MGKENQTNRLLAEEKESLNPSFACVNVNVILKRRNFYTILIGQVELLKLYAKLRCSSLSRQGNYNQACLFDVQTNWFTGTVGFSELQTTDISDEV